MTLFQLQQALYETRLQIKAAFERRVEVLNTIRHSLKQVGDDRPYPRETFGGDQASLQAPPAHPGLGPLYILTEEEVNHFMNSHKKKFYLQEAQVALARADNIDTGCSSQQCSSRQYGRFQGMLKMQFGGKKLLQEFLRTEQFERRMLPPLTPFPGPRPVARLPNKRSQLAKVNNKMRYYENLARDLMDPSGTAERATRRFDAVRAAMEKAKTGERLFTRTLKGLPRHRCTVVLEPPKALTTRARARAKASQHGSTSITTSSQRVWRCQTQGHRRQAAMAVPGPMVPGPIVPGTMVVGAAVPTAATAAGAATAATAATAAMAAGAVTAAMAAAAAAAAVAAAATARGHMSEAPGVGRRRAWE